MERRNARAGGFFIFLGAMAGTAVGIARGALMDGIVAGTAVGIVMAVAIWLIDRRSG